MGQSTTPAWHVAEQLRSELLQRQIARQHQQVELLRMPVQYVQRLDELWRRLNKAITRQWYGAARRLHNELRRIQSECAAELAAVQRQLDQHVPPLPSSRELIAELEQIEDEFDAWRYDARDNALCVTTEPIELEARPARSFRDPFDAQCPGHAGAGGTWSRLRRDRPRSQSRRRLAAGHAPACGGRTPV